MIHLVLAADENPLLGAESNPFSLCKAAGQNARRMHIVIQQEQVINYAVSVRESLKVGLIHMRCQRAAMAENLDKVARITTGL